MNFLANLVAGISLIFASVFGGHQVTPPMQLGSSVTQLPIVVANYQDSLAVQENTGDTSFTLVSGKDSLARGLSGFYCFTIDPNTAIAEYECGTASTTAVTSVTRGVDPVNPNVTNISLVFAHRRGAAVVISDYTPLAADNRLLSGSDTLPFALSYTNHPPCSSANSSTLVDWYCVSQVATSGAADAGIGSKGLVAVATLAQTVSGVATTSDGSGTLFYSPNNGNFNATNTGTGVVPVANPTISPSFIATSSGSSYSWSASSTFNGSTTVNGIFTVTASTSFANAVVNFGNNTISSGLTASCPWNQTMTTSSNQTSLCSLSGLPALGVNSYAEIRSIVNFSNNTASSTFSVNNTQLCQSGNQSAQDVSSPITPIILDAKIQNLNSTTSQLISCVYTATPGAILMTTSTATFASLNLGGIWSASTTASYGNGASLLASSTMNAIIFK